MLHLLPCACRPEMASHISERDDRRRTRIRRLTIDGLEPRCLLSSAVAEPPAETITVAPELATEPADANIQQAIDYIKENFKGDGLIPDIVNTLVDALKNDKIIYADIPAGKYISNTDTIQISSKYKTEPLATAFTLIHEGTHRIFEKSTPAAKPSKYEEFLAYAYEWTFYQQNFKDTPIPAYQDKMNPDGTINSDKLWNLTKQNYDTLPETDPNIKPPAGLPPGMKIPTVLAGKAETTDPAVAE